MFWYFIIRSRIQNAEKKMNVVRMIIIGLTTTSYRQPRFMNNKDKFDVTENRIISGRLTPDYRIQKDKYIFLAVLYISLCNTY